MIFTDIGGRSSARLLCGRSALLPPWPRQVGREEWDMWSVFLSVLWLPVGVENGQLVTPSSLDIAGGRGFGGRQQQKPMLSGVWREQKQTHVASISLFLDLMALCKITAEFGRLVGW